MNAAVTNTKEIVVVNKETPPIVSPIDAEVDVEVLRTVPKQFAIVDEQSANWLVRKIISAREYAEHVKEWSERELRRAAREEATLLFLFSRQLETWTTEQVSKLRERKSISLPAGTVGFRTIAACLQIDDEDSVIQWAKKNLPSAVITQPKMSRSILQDHFKTTGAIPDVGAHVEAANEKFYIR